MPVALIEGVRLHYDLAGPGSAPVVLLLHGLGSSGDDWSRQVPALTDRYRVLTVDRPGHHRSDRARGFPSVAAMAAIVNGLLESLEIPRAHVVGLSLGGCVAIALTLAAPGRVRSLVIANGFARLRPSGARAMARGATRLVLALVAPMRVVAAFVAGEAFPRREDDALRRAAIERIASNPRRRYLATLTAILRFDVRDRLAEIRCPTLVLAGSRDRTVPVHARHELREGIFGAELRIIEDSGHVSQFDQPAAFNSLVLQHLDRVEALGEDSLTILDRK
jgi:3-oxoadipate enol-lactonase